MPPVEAFGPLLFVDIALILCQSLAFSLLSVALFCHSLQRWGGVTVGPTE